MNPAPAPPELLSIFPSGKIEVRTMPARRCRRAPWQRERSLEDPATRRLYEALSVEEQLVPGIGTDDGEIYDGWGRAFVLGQLDRDFRYIAVARPLTFLEAIRVRNACNEIRSHMDDAQKGADMWAYLDAARCTLDEVAEAFHCSIPHVSKLTSPFKRGIPELLEALRRGEICATAAPMVAALDPELQLQALPLVIGKKRDKVKAILERLVGQPGGGKRCKSWKAAACGFTLSTKLAPGETPVTRLRAMHGRLGEVIKAVEKEPHLIHALPELLSDPPRNGATR